jgi:UDP-N-acetylmuramate--alanine ligase
MFGINKNLKIHFIGIGGIGMSGIAEILLNLGYQVSGSDLNESANTIKLQKQGAQIFKGHLKENIQEVQLVVYSSAINEQNPEIIEARELNIPIIKRAEMLAELMRLKYGIAVAGSHGKTTTSSFLATILHKMNYRPTSIIGGIVKNLGGHAIKGESEYLIAEADESDGSFLYLNPIMSIITNIDNDHLDYYKTQENIEAAFTEFANKVPFYGVVAINAHDEKSIELLNNLRRPSTTFGIKDEHTVLEEVDYIASNIEFTENGSSFYVEVNGEKEKATITLAGKHNVLNALGAIAIAHKVSGKLKEVCDSIAEFEGVGRRFENLYQNEKFIVVDDYAHHPTEITATIDTAKSKYPLKKIVAVFEPHRYSRTKEHWHEFINCFKHVDQVYITPIYAASEVPIEYIDSEILVKNINEKYQNADYFPSWNNLPSIFEKFKDSDVILLSMGAGSISKATREQIEQWTSKQ